MRVEAGAAAVAGLAAALVLIAFVTGGGDTLGPNTWTEIALVVIGAAVAIWLIVSGAPGRGPGGLALALFGAVTLLTALSVLWSVEPDQSWIEAGRTLAYFAVFAAALAVARRLPARWPAAVGGIAVFAIALSAWAVLVKVFTWQIGEQVQYGRLLSPFGYWNATGLVAALGLPALLWAAGRRGSGPLVRGLTAPAMTLLITVVVLSYSRSALAAAVLGSAVPLVLGQTRLRAVALFAIGAAGAAAVCGWALGDHALTGDGLTHAARVGAGHSLGLVFVLVLVLVSGAGVIAARAADRARLSDRDRRRIGAALVGLARARAGRRRDLRCSHPRAASAARSRTPGRR